MKKLASIILFWIFATNLSFAQNNNNEELKSYYKAFAFGFPEVGFVGTLNYERQLSKYTSIDLSANLLLIQGEYHNTLATIIYPTYKMYMHSKNRFLKNLWMGPYLSYIYGNTLKYNGGFDNAFGAGFAFGRKTFFKKNGRGFVDIGLGLSIDYGVSVDKINCIWDTEFPLFVTRLIFLFGFSN